MLRIVFTVQKCFLFICKSLCLFFNLNHFDILFSLLNLTPDLNFLGIFFYDLPFLSGMMASCSELEPRAICSKKSWSIEN